MVIEKLIPDALKLTEIPLDEIVNGFYFNKIIEGYNNRVDNVNEYHRLYHETLNKLEEYKREHRIMKRILHENGLWETFLNDDEFLKYLKEDD